MSSSCDGSCNEPVFFGLAPPASNCEVLMAATGKAASKKAESSSYNYGDEGYYEDDGAGVDMDFYYDKMKQEENKEKNKVYKREPNAKELKEKQEAEEFERRKERGLVHLAPDKLALLTAEEERLKAKKKAERAKQQEEAEKAAQLQALKEEKLRERRYKKSSEFKRKSWQEQLQARIKLDEEWEKTEKRHRQREEEHRAAKEVYDRQRRIDESWQPKKVEATAKSAPKPAGKKGKAMDASRYGGALPPAALKRMQETDGTSEKVEPLPWDPEKGDKNPNRPEQEKKAEEAAWEKKQRAWKKHLEDWSKTKHDHQKEAQRLRDAGLYDDEPEFQTDPESGDEHSDADSDSDF